jgi:hypothetical protein
MSVAQSQYLLIKNSTISNNIASSGGMNSVGGAIWLGTGYLELDNALVTKNFASASGGDSFGGGIYIDSGELHITNSVISNNTANYGAGISIYPTSDPFGYTGSIESTTITQNQAQKNGGGVFVRNAFVALVKSNLTSNQAIDNGGGLYADEGSTVSLSETIIMTNSATGGGGGTYCANANITFYRSSIYDNQNNDDIICFQSCNWVGMQENPCNEACIDRLDLVTVHLITYRDVCSVCNGNGSSCAGCDGIPWDDNVDVCGVCGGNNSTCKGNPNYYGCDGVFGSGLQVDRCGVCGGDNSSCANITGCDGVLGSGKRVDKCGKCGGDGNCVLPKSAIPVLVGTVVAVVAVVVILLIGVMYVRKRHPNFWQTLTNKKPPPKEFLPVDDTEIDFKELKRKEQIGAGAFGTVYRGEWRMIPVAISTYHLIASFDFG